METLIFNSYIGGACIFEYCDGKTELLRYNDRYAEIFHTSVVHEHLISRKDILSMMDEENAALAKSNIETAIRTKKDRPVKTSMQTWTAKRYTRARRSD